MGETAPNTELMGLNDKKNLLHPWLGVHGLTTWLGKELRLTINKKYIERLFRLMGYR